MLVWDGYGALGIGDWRLGPIPNPQSPIPNPQSPYTENNFFKKDIYINLFNELLNKIY